MEAGISAYDQEGQAADSEPVVWPKVSAETVVRNAVAVVAAPLLPGAVVGLPVLGPVFPPYGLLDTMLFRCAPCRLIATLRGVLLPVALIRPLLLLGVLLSVALINPLLLLGVLLSIALIRPLLLLDVLLLFVLIGPLLLLGVLLLLALIGPLLLLGVLLLLVGLLLRLSMLLLCLGMLGFALLFLGMVLVFFVVLPLLREGRSSDSKQ